jgi:hypothetical protein
VRADIIFFIFLYQRWIYPVDKTRVNEFGQSGEDDPSVEGAPADASAITAPTAVDAAAKKNH